MNVFACKQCHAYFSPNSDEMTFLLEKAILWVEDVYFSQKQWFEVKNNLRMDLFLTNMFINTYINWWTGEVWIIVMFLSAVWTLILTAPIHCKGSIDEQMM